MNIFLYVSDCLNSFCKSNCCVKMITLVYVYLDTHYCHLDPIICFSMPGRIVPLSAGTSVGLSANAQSFSMWPFCIKWAFISWCWLLRGRKWKLLTLVLWFWRFQSIHYILIKAKAVLDRLDVGRSCELLRQGEKRLRTAMLGDSFPLWTNFC